jgi:hypothetical protein
MSTLTNPYKQAGSNPVLKRISCDVSEDSWRKLKQFYPDQGIQDAILSNLFFSFFNEFLTLAITPPATPDEFTSVKNQLRRLVQRRANPPAPGR